MFRRTLTQLAFRRMPKRSMGDHGHGHEARHYEGAEAVVRKFLPEDHHMALGIMGFYATLFGVWKIKSSFSKKEEKVEAPAAAAVTDGIPSVDSPEFAAWLEVAGNFERIFTEAN